MAFRLDAKRIGRLMLYCVVVAAVLTVPFFIQSPYILHILILAGIYLILAQSLNLMLGYVGFLSLAQTAFFGIGAYTSTILTVTYKQPFWIGLTLAVIFPSLIAAVIGIPFLRLSRHSFVISTLGFLLICWLVARNWVEVTRGPLGIPGIPSPTLNLFDVMELSFSSRASYYILVMLSVLVITSFLLKLVNSRIGRAFIAIREDEALAQSVGINTLKYKLVAFSISAGIAGVAGSLFAHYITFLDPTVFEFYNLENILVITLVGGSGTIGGPILGSVIFTILPEALRVAKEYRLIIYGFILLFTVLLMPEGVGGRFKAYVHKRRLKEVYAS
ncbi:MAG: branched-chain amino acid ABC transporter permease [Nitrososphaerales archaeon]